MDLLKVLPAFQLPGAPLGAGAGGLHVHYQRNRHWHVGVLGSVVEGDVEAPHWHPALGAREHTVEAALGLPRCRLELVEDAAGAAKGRQSHAALSCRGAAKAAALLVVLAGAEELVQLPVDVQQGRGVKAAARAQAALLTQASRGGQRAHLCVCVCQGLDTALLALKHAGTVKA